MREKCHTEVRVVPLNQTTSLSRVPSIVSEQRSLAFLVSDGTPQLEGRSVYEPKKTGFPKG
jgi:hypothetical protein